MRIGHWVLVVAFATAYLTEGEPEWLHVWAGYAIAATVALRLLWGVIGPQRARFSDFVTGPGRAVAYLRDLIAGRAERHVGHSPAGGAMTVALLVTLGVTAFAGMGTLAAEEGEGPLAGIVAQIPETDGPRAYTGDHDEDEHGEHGEESAWKEVHEVAANLTLILILLHLGGVALASARHGENLARSMVTGDKRA
ncbi:Cytochrome B561 [Rhodovulum sp. P5]|nr:Cytochrome B561 [Rhodovulum sp. P5]